ncbi:MAG TPA: hypothetical protein VMB91_08105 [Solirubrobacteraceae bacterium]|nr:hypothetical protein [Solirubrobacteraceae bacterium]
MKRIGIVAMVAAAIGLAALAASSVAAAAGSPEYLACGKAAKSKETKKYTGHYSNKECSEVSATNEGKYERVASTKFPVKTKAKFGETTIYLYNPLEHKTVSEVPCKTGAASGTINNATEGTVTLTYKGCNVPEKFKNGEKAQFAGACNSPGKKKEEVVTEQLTTKLVWLDEAETVPGVILEPTTPGGTFESVECLAGIVKVRQYGSILADLTPAGSLPKVLTATLNANTETGEPEFGSYWSSGTQTEVKLLSEIHAPNIEEPGVPTSEVSAIPLKDGKVLVN